MDNQEVVYLTSLLLNKSKERIHTAQTLPTVLNNIVYYVPRIRSMNQLVTLLDAFFSSECINIADPLKLHDMGQAIFQWKLQISEPSIPLSEFFDVWNHLFQGCQTWAINKIAILSGILTTREKFTEIQGLFYIDDSGVVSFLYDQWRSQYFIPLWAQFFNQSLNTNPTVTESLALIYSTIGLLNDLNNKKLDIQWNVVTHSSINLIRKYIEAHNEKDTSFLANNINQVAKILQISLLKTTSEYIMKILQELQETCFKLSEFEAKSSMPNKHYSNKYYSKTYIAVILILKGCLKSRNNIRSEWYQSALLCLYFLNFIALDFGTIGFESYDFVYELTTVNILKQNKSNPKEMYHTLISNLNGHIKSEKYPNKINDSRILFLLNFLEKTNNSIHNLDLMLIENVELPIINKYVNSSFKDLRESSHSAMIALYTNSSSSNELLEWKNRHFLDYISLSIFQYRSNKLSKHQLQIIFKTMCSTLSSLNNINPELPREYIHLTYQTLINVPIQEREKRKELLKGVIYQLPYVNRNYITDWLENVVYICNHSEFDKYDSDEIMSCLWDVISGSKEDISLRWWYINVVPVNSKL